MFFEALQSYYAPVSTLIIFLVLVITNHIFTLRVKKLFVIEIIIIFLIIIATWSDRCLSAVIDNDFAWRFRTLTTFINFAVSPLSPMILVMIYNTDDNKKTNRLFFIPAVANIIICIVSVINGCIFYISSENIYSRGMLFFLPFLISAFYLFSLIIFSAHQTKKPNRKSETFLLSFIMIVIGIATILEIVFVKRFMIWSTTEICVILYYLFLTIHEILYDPLTGVFSRSAYLKYYERKKGKNDCTIAMIDLNKLKKINDDYGHSAGDFAIYKLASSIENEKLRNMHLYRYGGDEFLLLADKLCEQKVKNVLENAQTQCDLYKDFKITFSYGIAECKKNEDFDKAILQADDLMYSHKKICNKKAVD